MSSLSSSARRTDRRDVALGAAMVLVAAAAIVGAASAEGTMKDLDVYLLAARRFADGATVYGVHFGQSLREPLPYTYPPVLAAGLGAVAWAPRIWVTIAWTVLDLALLAWIVRVSYGRLLDRIGRRRFVMLAALVGILGLTAPVLSVFDLGQIGIVLTALVLADALPQRTRLPRGSLVGAATAIKLVPGVFVVYWTLTKRWRPMIVAIGTAVAVWSLTAIVRPDISRTYWFNMAWQPERVGDVATVVDQSLNGMLQRLGWSSPIGWFALALGTFVVGLVRARRAHEAGDELAAVSLIGIASLLASPVSWIHHAVWIVPATGVLLGDGNDRRRQIAWAATLVLFLSHVPLLQRAGVAVEGWLAFVVQNAFVLAYVALLLLLPIGDRADAARARPFAIVPARVAAHR